MRQSLDNAEYECIADFISAMQLEPVNPKSRTFWHGHSVDDNRDHTSWYGANCKTGLDVQKKVHDGWPEGRDRLNELRSKIGELELAPQDRKRRLVRADSGDTLDIHAVYAGRLDIAWRTAKRRNTSGPQHIELCANMICSGAEHADVLFWRGAAAAVLLDVLEQAGYSVRLVVNFGGEMYGVNNAEKVSCRITVKDHGMPFDITSTSATIMPGFFRALGHAWIASHCQGKMSDSGISVRQGKTEPNEILLSHTIRDHGTALAFINDTIARLNSGAMAA